MPRRPPGKPPKPMGPQPLPPEYLSVRDVCADLGIASPNAFQMRRRRNPDSVPPLVKIGYRVGILRDDYAAWKRARHLDTVREMTRKAAELRRKAAKLEQEASQALAQGAHDAAAS